MIFTQKKLSFKTTQHKKLIFRNLIIDIFKYKTIKTSSALGKEVCKSVNKLYTLIKKNINDKQKISRILHSHLASDKKITSFIISKCANIKRKGSIVSCKKYRINSAGGYDVIITLLT